MPVPWTVQEERSSARFARGFGRGLLWLVIGLAALTGIREWVYATDTQVTEVEADEDSFPREDAQAVAARFTRAYLSWDEDNPQERAQQLAAELPAGADTDMGWDGAGYQRVLDVQAGEVSVTSKSAARVDVSALVQSGTLEDTEDTTDTGQDSSGWMALEVPVTVADGQVVVSGAPGLVGVRDSGPYVSDQETAETDTDLANATRRVVERFFAAYASGDDGDLSAELAPGAEVPALSSGMEFVDLESWSVVEGRGEKRSGTAVVVLALSGAELTQTYDVELTRVTASSGQRWQVSDVHGGQA